MKKYREVRNSDDEETSEAKWKGKGKARGRPEKAKGKGERGKSKWQKFAMTIYKEIQNKNP